MSRIEEEQKLERIHQARQDPYQQYQAYLDGLDLEENQVQQVGEMRGKKVKQLSSDAGLNPLFNHFLKK